jgi:hypothetical protein
MKSLIDSLRADPKYSPQRSQKWFADRVKEMTGRRYMSGIQMLGMHQSQLTTTIIPGQMFSFVYDPKHKKTLPFYDKFPLLLPFNKDREGFIGLNLHYLKPSQRIGLLNNLMDVAKNDKYGNPKKLELSWNYLTRVSKMNEAAICVKRYLNGHVKSRFMRIEPEHWVEACMLPTENWAKGKPY